MAATIEDARAAFRRNFVNAGMPERADEFLSLVRPAIFFRPEPPIFEEDIPLGASKIGGSPDLPAELMWPEDLRTNDTHLALLAQLNLADVPTGVLDIALPSEGLLLAFAEEAGAVGRLLWIPSGQTLARRNVPRECENFPVRRLFPTIELTIESQRSEFDHYHKNKDWPDFIMNGREDDPVVQLGGDPFLIQNPLEHECEEIAGSLTSLSREDARWVFIMQVDSVPEAEMMWGDGGSAYFLLRAADLRACRFENAVVTMQCY